MRITGEVVSREAQLAREAKLEFWAARSRAWTRLFDLALKTLITNFGGDPVALALQAKQYADAAIVHVEAHMLEYDAKYRAIEAGES